MSESSRLNRREFAKTAGSAAAASLLFSNLPQAFAGTQRRRYAIVGTGIRGTSMWGAELFKHYSDVIEFVGLCDLNPKRVTIASEIIGVQCPTFTSFEEM